MILAEPSVTAEMIRDDFHRAMEEARLAAGHAGCAIRLAVECGKKLARAKEERSGEFDAWLEREVPEISAMTSWRWRKLAAAPEALYANASSLRQAYIDVGILPAPAPAEEGEPARPAGNYLVHLARAERALHRQLSEVARLPRKEKDLLKKRLEPLVKLYAEL